MMALIAEAEGKLSECAGMQLSIRSSVEVVLISVEKIAITRFIECGKGHQKSRLTEKASNII